MTKQLELADIQGNVLRAYGRFGYPVARYVFFNIRNPAAARRFVGAVTQRVTTAIDWSTGAGKKLKPDWTVNMAFSYLGLRELELPRASLVEFSPEFSQGMKARKDVLGDQGPSDPGAWDPIWQDNQSSPDKNVHILITLNGLMPDVDFKDLAAVAAAHKTSQDHRDQAYAWLQSVIAEHADGVVLLGGHRGDNNQLLDYQDADVIFQDGMPTPKEHFGYTDGISDPVFERALR